MIQFQVALNPPWPFMCFLQLDSLSLPPLLSSTQYNVNATVGGNDIADFSNLRGVRSLFKGLLHLTTTEPAKVSFVGMRRAVGMDGRQLGEFLGRSGNLCLESFEDFNRLLLGARDV